MDASTRAQLPHAEPNTIRCSVRLSTKTGRIPGRKVLLLFLRRASGIHNYEKKSTHGLHKQKILLGCRTQDRANLKRVTLALSQPRSDGESSRLLTVGVYLREATHPRKLGAKEKLVGKWIVNPSKRLFLNGLTTGITLLYCTCCHRLQSLQSEPASRFVANTLAREIWLSIRVPDIDLGMGLRYELDLVIWYRLKRACMAFTRGIYRDL